MKKRTPSIDLLPWQVEGFKKGIKTQMTFLADPQPGPDDTLGTTDIGPTGFGYYRTGAGLIVINNPLGVKHAGEILFCKKHRMHLEVTDHIAVFTIDKFTDQDALNEGVACLYPASHFGGEGFYLENQILEATALQCFQDYWNKQPENKGFEFDRNPYVITFGLKVVKL